MPTNGSYHTTTHANQWLISHTTKSPVTKLVERLLEVGWWQKRHISTPG
ncbi:unnamed protein product [Brassica oleracea]